MQLLVVGTLARRFGVQRTLVGGAVVTTLTFATLALVPGVLVLLWVNSGLRVLEFGIGKPARDMLWTVVDRESKYKVKNVIDTVVYRGADVLGGWCHAALTAAGVSLGGIAAVAAGIGGVLIGGAYVTGRAYRRRGGQ
jgi:AAA family ATP:ADP antiporter